MYSQENKDIKSSADEYLTDARGNLIKKENVKEIDLLRDELIKKIMDSSNKVSLEVDRFKTDAISEIGAFVSLAAAEHGVNVGGAKGNVTLTSFDGKFKVMLAQADRICFNEQIVAVKELIKEALDEMMNGVSGDIHAIVNKAFEVDGNGNVSTARVLGLRTLKISNDKWNRAMNLIADAIKIESTKQYVRVYRRDEAGDYSQISLR